MFAKKIQLRRIEIQLSLLAQIQDEIFKSFSVIHTTFIHPHICQNNEHRYVKKLENKDELVALVPKKHDTA